MRMSLCCFPFFRGSGQKKAQRERFFCCCTNWCKRHRRHPLPSFRRTRQSSNKDIAEELADTFTYAINGYKGQVGQARKGVQCQTETSKEDIMEVVAHGPGYTTYWVRVQVNQANDTIQCLSESSNKDIIEKLVNGFNYSTSLDQEKMYQATDTIQVWTQCAAVLTLRLREACRMRALQKGTLEKVVGSLVPAFPAGNIPHICTLMPTHPAFSRAQRFLEELLTRSCLLSMRCDAIKVFSTSGGTPPYHDQGDTPQGQVIKAIASMVETWLDQVQGFGQPLPFALFEVEQALLQVNSPASHRVGHAQILWVELEHLEPTEATREGPHPEIQSSPEPEEGPAQGPEPGPARGPALDWPGLRQYLKPLWSQLLSALEAFSLCVLRVLGIASNN